MSSKVSNGWSTDHSPYNNSGYPQKTSFRCRLLATLLLLMLLIKSADFCGPGRGYGFRRGPRKMTPLVFKQHVPSVSETTLGASGPSEGKISRGDSRMKKLVVNYNKEIIFKDEEGTGSDRIMTKRCKELLDALSVMVMNQWEGVRLRVTEAWDEEGYHAPESLHYEGRAVDITTSDRDRSKYGMLARLAVEVGFDWVYFESRGHVHCSVKSDSSITLRTGGCFSADDTVQLESGERKRLADVTLGDKVLAMDSTGQRIYDEVIAFIHRDTRQPMIFSSLSLSDGSNITLTPDHLIYVKGESGEPEPIFVSLLLPGSYLYISNFNDSESLDILNYKPTKFNKVRINKIDFVHRIGVYAPLTASGTIVVNDVVASCYASVSKHWLAHASMIPLRISSFIHRLVWQRSNEEQEGVHWFAEMLRLLGRHLLPSSYWYT